jgi:hypothetical protein
MIAAGDDRIGFQLSCTPAKRTAAALLSIGTDLAGLAAAQRLAHAGRRVSVLAARPRQGADGTIPAGVSGGTGRRLAARQPGEPLLPLARRLGITCSPRRHPRGRSSPDRDTGSKWSLLGP